MRKTSFAKNKQAYYATTEDEARIRANAEHAKMSKSEFVRYCTTALYERTNKPLSKNR